MGWGLEQATRLFLRIRLMTFSITLLILMSMTTVAYIYARRYTRSVASSVKPARLHSLPSYHAAWVACACAIPALFVLAIWFIAQDSIVMGLVVSDLPDEIRLLPQDQLNLVLNDLINQVKGGVAFNSDKIDLQPAVEQFLRLQGISQMAALVVIIGVALISAVISKRYISSEFRARNNVETIIKIFLIICSTIAVLTTVGIVLSVLSEAIRFFHHVSITDFLFGLVWSPQTAIRADQAGSSGAFGILPLMGGTILISLIAMLVAVPIGLLAAIYLSEYATSTVRTYAKPVLEILAGIPTVVYGFFAALTVAPFFRNSGELIGLSVSSESALAAGLVMGIMIIPFVSSLSDDVINAVPQSLRDASFGIGATHSETIRQVVLPAALPGIAGSVLLAVSRAIGETMIVVMAAGLSANLTANPLDSVTTITVQIVTLLVGDQEFDSPKTLAAFALGLTLFISTLCLNIIALRIVRKYQEQYD